jgi:hypothetical protein
VTRKNEMALLVITSSAKEISVTEKVIIRAKCHTFFVSVLKSRASMLEKKGTDYKLYLKSEPQSELRSELGKYFVGVQFINQSSVFPFKLQIIFQSLVLNIKFRLFPWTQIID